MSTTPRPQLLQPGQTLHHFPPLKTPTEEAGYAQVAQRMAHPEGVGVEGEEGGGGEDLRAAGSPRLFRTHLLTYVGRFASSHIRLPLVRGRTECVIADDATSHLADSARTTLGGPHPQLSPIYVRKESKHQLTVPSNPINSHRSGMDANVFFTAVMPGLYGEPGVNNVLDVRGGGAALLAWRTIIKVGEEVRKDEPSERTGKPPPGRGGEVLPATRERNGLLAVVAGPIALREKVWKLQDDGLLLPILKSCFRRQAIESLRSHLNPNGGVLFMIESGTPMGFEAIAYARSTILKDYIKDVGKAFQPLPTTNARGTANPPIEEGPAL
ncbi:hypothetical protein HOY80DRAFT_1100467 [Tuber brumale]|nr:hypothetical protein HOY80DRAFT_1100467 [Tuber brumale]